MSTVLIKNATVVNEGKSFKGGVIITDEFFSSVFEENQYDKTLRFDKTIDAQGKLLIPGAIDDQVHFREPGLTHKATIYTESKAAVAGGITSFMEMPNTNPQAVTQTLLEDKYKRASETSLANYSFFFGATNDNLNEVLKTNGREVCGVKVFMGSSTGNMLVDNRSTLEALFKECPLLIATHCEDEATIRANTEIYRQQYGEEVPIEMHPNIRSAEACYISSSMAMELATKHNTKLHILHISTEKELSLFRNDIPLSQKRITAEACVHHLWFSAADYARKGTLIKWNPAVKTMQDREAIRKALADDRIDILATDHAPHTLEEKGNSYFKAPSGGPLVQHALVAMLELVKKEVFTIEKVVQKMSHAPADLFQIEKRGYIKPGFYADLVLVDLDKSWTVDKSNLLYKCGWSPFEGERFSSAVTHTFVNGNLVYENGIFDETKRGKRMLFNR